MDAYRMDWCWFSPCNISIPSVEQNWHFLICILRTPPPPHIQPPVFSLRGKAKVSNVSTCAWKPHYVEKNNFFGDFLNKSNTYLGFLLYFWVGRGPAITALGEQYCKLHGRLHGAILGATAGLPIKMLCNSKGSLRLGCLYLCISIAAMHHLAGMHRYRSAISVQS